MTGNRQRKMKRLSDRLAIRDRLPARGHPGLLLRIG